MIWIFLIFLSTIQLVQASDMGEGKLTLTENDLLTNHWPTVTLKELTSFAGNCTDPVQQASAYLQISLRHSNQTKSDHYRRLSIIVLKDIATDSARPIDDRTSAATLGLQQCKTTQTPPLLVDGKLYLSMQIMLTQLKNGTS